MSSYKIVSAQGQEMGVYEGETKADALDAMARDAGYDSQAAAAEVAGPFDGTIAELVAPTNYGTLCDYSTGSTIRPATADEEEASIEQAKRDGGAGVIWVECRPCYVES